MTFRLANCRRILKWALDYYCVSGDQEAKRGKEREMGKAGKDELTLRGPPRATVLPGKPTLSICMRVESMGSRCRSISNNVWTLVLFVCSQKDSKREKHLLSGSPAPIAGFSTCDYAYTKRRVFLGFFFVPYFFLLPSFSFIFYFYLFFSFLPFYLILLFFFFFFSLPFKFLVAGD